jgi:hypothetical protein
VLAAWREALAACTGSNVAGVRMLSDGDSEFSLSLGLVDDFGPELGEDFLIVARSSHECLL